MMKIWLDNSFHYGSVFVAEEDFQIVGVAVLQAPNDQEINIIDFSHKESSTLINLAGKDTLNAFINMCQMSDLACHRLPDPKWYLVLLAVSAEYKNRGIGSQLLQKSVIPSIAAQGGGLLAFNTNAEENRSFYQKNGFAEFDESVLYENGMKLGNWSYKRQIENSNEGKKTMTKGLAGR